MNILTRVFRALGRSFTRSNPANPGNNKEYVDHNSLPSIKEIDEPKFNVILKEGGLDKQHLEYTFIVEKT